MASGTPGGEFRVGSLAIAALTLLVPLITIVVAALGRPAPTPALPMRPAAAISAPLIEEAPALPAPPIVAPPPAPTPQTLNPLPRWAREESLSFLLLGIDRRNDDEIYRTDTIVVANLDLRTQRASLVSIPRDLVMTIPGYGQDRVNSAFAIGETQRTGRGLPLLRETIERNFGITLNHYAVVDFNCFRAAVDALGGVTVNVPSRIYDPSYPTDDYGYMVVTFEPGTQWLDGERALEYARTRYGDTDFGRMRRQQQLLTALRDQALKVRNLSMLPQAARACSGMASDLNVLDLVALGASAREINAANISLKVVDEQMAVPYIAPSGASVLMPRWDLIRAMVRSAIPAGSTASASRPN